MNPRRMVVEDRALALAERIDPRNTFLAARLRETVPETFGLCDEHVPLLRQVLEAVAGADVESAPDVSKILAALDDLPTYIGRRGQVWASQDHNTGAYSAYWSDDDWLEAGPEGVSREAVLEWAAARTDDVRLTESYLSQT